MDKYLELLKKMKNSRWNEKYLPQLEKIEAYVKGEITQQELISDADDITRGIIHLTINKILNYKEKEIKYYIKLPQDKYFNISNAPCILAGKIVDYEIISNSLETIGPEYHAKRWPSFHEQQYTEITGDFSKYPKGIMLYYSDWYKIISKYPNLHERMYYLTINDYEKNNKNLTLEQVKENVNKQISKWKNAPQDSEPNIHWLGKEEAQYIPQEVIDSIKFVIPIEYLTKEQILSGEFGTFEEIAIGTTNHQKKK